MMLYIFVLISAFIASAFAGHITALDVEVDFNN